MAIVLAAKSLKLRDDDPDYPALAIAGYVLGSGGSSRLFKRLRQKDGLSYGAFGDVQAGSLDERSTLYGGAILAPDNADKGMAALLQEMALLFDKGIGEQELADAKAAFTERTATQLASDQHLVSLLSEGLHVGRTLTFDKQLQASIEALTATQVNEAVRRHLSSENLALIKAGALDSAP
jgi:zinc protease